MAWLSIREAAERLDVSEVRVRQLAAAGELGARRHSAVWLIDEGAVEARRDVPRRAGRPIEPESAWLLLSVLADASRFLVTSALEDDEERLALARALIAVRNDAVHGRQLSESGRILARLVHDRHMPSEAIEQDPLHGVEDVRARNLRRRLRRRLRGAPEPKAWSAWLGSRAERRRYWAHPGVTDRLRNDDRLSLGGAWAAALSGADVAPGDDVEAYVRERVLDAVVHAYRLREDPDGRVILRVIPSTVSDTLLPQAGRPTAPVVAALDLYESPDTRSRRVAMSWLHDFEELLSNDFKDHDREDLTHERA